MFIKRIYLENFIGIYQGLGKYSIDINFDVENSMKNKIVMLVGQNGSGKTSLLSQLHPFWGSNDDRQKLIIPGKIGIKIIEIVQEDSIFFIQHQWKNDVTKSFIKLDGEELNPNGNVTSFKEVVKQYLGVTEDYLKVGKIGSNVSGFVGMKTSERKNYISKFLPDIDDYLLAYKIVNKKFRDLKRDVSITGDSITQMESESSLNDSLKSYESQLATIEKNIKEYDAKVNKGYGELDSLDPDRTLRETEVNPYFDDYKGSEKNLQLALKSIENLKTKYPNIKEYGIPEEYIEAANKYTIKSVNFENDAKKEKEASGRHTTTANELKISADRKRKQLQESLKGLSVTELKKDKEVKEASILRINEEINSLALGDRYQHLKSKNISQAKSYIESLRNILVDIKQSSPPEFMDELINMFKSEEFLNNDSYIDDRLERFNSLKETSSQTLTRLKNTLAIIEENAKKTDILKKRPGSCRIDGCEFIRDALRFVNSEAEMITKQEQIASESAKLEKLNIDVEKLEKIHDIIVRLINTYNSAVTKNGVYSVLQELPCAKYVETFANFSNSLSLSLKKIEDLFSINSILNYLELKEEKEILDVRVAEITDTISSLDGQLKMSNQILEEAESEELKAKENLQLRDESEKKYASLMEQSTIEKQKADVMTEFSSSLKIKIDSENLMNASRANWERYEEIIGKIEKLALEIDDNEELSALANNETLPLKQKIKVVEAKIAKLSELNSRLVNLKENYQNYELIKLALDPIKGIPLIFIGCHLKETAKIANNLLDKAYNGRFRIMFEVDDKNFFIRVLTGDGGGLDDVRMASQGETSLTSLSLSLSLIQQSVGGGYNILCLDEVDATLDSNNRSTFVEMLETQMDQLGSEQAFVISHNDQFSDYPVDLILLKGNSAQTEDESWMIGKNVVYDWRTA